jgi:NNP family nitrate/nitrite transporter-like MFS transporter
MCTSFVPMALFLGLGTGGVFAWVAELAPAERVGAITGIVGACGGLGGFFPPLVMGATYNEAQHSYTLGLILLTTTAGGALLFTLFGMRRKTAATT